MALVSKLGIAHFTTGRFPKGHNRNVPSIHEEMPFGIGIEIEQEDEVGNF
jgi:hypothetical protein